MGRKERVEHAIREALAELIAREVKDPRVAAAGVLGVSQVECTPDLSVARAWISVYADDRVAQAALAGLRGAAGFLRGPLGRRLRMQRAPELRFELDVTAVMARKLRDIVQEDEARARAAGRAEPAPAAPRAAPPRRRPRAPPAEPPATPPAEPSS
ncbi:MAG: 30S ribosome-binding factor RbfA [Kofleriaceae bacterium]|nr:30S ribosome-binding factor RbfA [Kofleriaceae bacterium]